MELNEKPTNWTDWIYIFGNCKWRGVHRLLKATECGYWKKKNGKLIASIFMFIRSFVYVRIYQQNGASHKRFTVVVFSFVFFSSRGSALFIHPGLNAERGKCSRKIVKNWWHKCNVAHLPPSSAPVAYQEFLGSEANWRFKMRQVLLNFRLLKKRSSESLWRLQS